VFDGEFEAVRSFEVSGTNVSAEVTLPETYTPMFYVVHLSDGDRLYTLEDAAVESYDTTIGELWSDISLNAMRVSVRKL
jgi:hypothetical protein